MNFGEKDVKKLSTIALVALLVILAFLLIRPVIIPILGGLILAYVFMPLYKKINKRVKNKTLAATLVSLIIVLAIFIILWFITPLIIEQVFQLFTASQKLDVQSFVNNLFSTASDQFKNQLTVTINAIISKASSVTINSLISILLDLPTVLLDLFILGFVFFYALRDAEKLREFVKGLSPLSESKEKVIAKHFKDMTDSIIYGQIIVGIIQGLLAGLGFYLFGVKSVLVLSIIAIFFSIIPFLGPAFVWVPVSIYLFATGSKVTATLFLLYNLFIVSLIDNIIRSHLIAKKTKISPAIVLIGMLGGIFVFGILGLIIGPLLLAYLITLLESFKDKSIYALFSDSA